MSRLRLTRLDVALLAALLAWALVEALLLAGPGTRAGRALLAVALVAPLALRRSAPVAAAAIVAGEVTLRAVLVDGAPAEEGAMPLPVVLIAAYSVAVHARALVLAVAGGVVIEAAVIAVVARSYWVGGGEPSDMAILSFFVVAAWSAGFFVRRRIAGGEAAARDAVLAERARISRELHDIVGHSVSVIALQAGAAEQLVRRDPDAAVEHLAAVQRTAREALAEMRRLMGVLREDDADYAPQPGLDALGALVEQARRAGMDVDVTQDGEPRPLAPGVDVAAYRIVQEALTNARKHAGAARARVRISYEPDAVAVEVRNDGGPGGLVLAGDAGGTGLAGMGERARLFGGTLDAGAEPGGGFRVRARLPVEAPR